MNSYLIMKFILYITIHKAELMMIIKMCAIPSILV